MDYDDLPEDAPGGDDENTGPYADGYGGEMLLAPQPGEDLSDLYACFSATLTWTGGDSHCQGDGSIRQQRHPVTPLSDTHFPHFAACSPQQAFSPYVEA